MAQQPPLRSADGQWFWDGSQWTYSGVRYAGFWIRFLAVFVDGLIIAIPLGLVFFALYASTFNAALANQGTSQGGAITSSPFNGVSLVLGFLYFSYFWGTGSTPGMRIFGLHVVDAGSLSGPIGFGRAALRYVGYVVSSFCCYLGLIWAAFDSRKQGWHDKIAGTVVVHR